MNASVVVRQVFRSGFWRAVAVGWALFVAFNVWDVGRRGWPSGGVIALLIVGALSVVVYALGWRPAVIADTPGIEMRNPARTITLPWNVITDIDATDALRVHVGSKVYRAWSVSRGGGVSSVLRSASRGRGGRPGIEADALAALARQSPADYAAAVLSDSWRQNRSRTRGTVFVRWAWPEALVLVAFVVAAIVVARLP